MINLDYAVLLIAGILGAFGAHTENAKLVYARPLAWFIVGLWALLKLLKVF